MIRPQKYQENTFIIYFSNNYLSNMAIHLIPVKFFRSSLLIHKKPEPNLFHNTILLNNYLKKKVTLKDF